MSTLAPLTPLPPLTEFHPTCKVCDRGQLFPKKIFRMSGPVVAIGFILLIPSILGMIASALIFFGVIAYNGDKSNSNTTEQLNPAESELPQQQNSQSLSTHESDNEFRRACAAGVIESVQRETNRLPTLPSVTQVCECSLDTMKQGNFSGDTTDACAKRWQHGDFEMPDPKAEIPYVQVYKSYADPLGYQDALARAKSTEKRASPHLAWFHLLGGTFAIALGVASFVGGLLGWLLVMKKRVLQCSICGAAVSAS